MRRFTIVIALVVAIGGCKKKRSAKTAAAVAKMQELASTMCACKDRTCADGVQEAMTRWSAEMAKEGDYDSKPDEIMIKTMMEAGQRYAECMTKLMTPDEPPPPPPPKPEVPAAAPKTATVGELLAMARAFASTEDPPMVTAAVEADYVDADGNLDAEAGELTIVLGTASQPGDDPKRRTGAPARPPAAARNQCTRLHWRAARGWWSERWRCIEARPPYPRCSVTEIWKRAIAKGAPADAVAVVQISESMDRLWYFSITDEPRNVKIEHTFADDCALAVEKP